MTKDNDQQTKQDRIESGIHFITQKGLFADNPQLKQQHLHNLRNIATLSPPLQDQYNKVQNRLNHFLAKQERRLDQPSLETHHFSTLEFPGYDPTNLVFLTYPRSIVQRINHSSGLTKIEAPTIVQSYAIAKSNPRKREMIDIMGLREGFTAKELERYIFDLMDSKELLKRMILCESELVDCEDVGLIPVSLDKYGAGLVSQFKVFEDFLNMSTHKHYGKPTGKFVGNHSMALVGYRREGEKLFFLLQNWWRTKQFVEIDEEYLKDSGSIVTFIVTPQISVPSNFLSHSLL